jgi:hypothetical protein
MHATAMPQPCHSHATAMPQSVAEDGFVPRAKLVAGKKLWVILSEVSLNIHKLIGLQILVSTKCLSNV